MPALHELSDRELREKLSTGELSDKKATIARALLRRRRQERLRELRLAKEAADTEATGPAPTRKPKVKCRRVAVLDPD